MTSAIIVYLLCALTSALCAALLYRNYRRQKSRALFWSAICFAGLTLNNVLLIIDIFIVIHHDLSVVRTLPAVFGFAALIWGFTWERQ